MRKIFIGLMLIGSLFFSTARAQYQPGLIVTQTNDTIVCFVPIVSFFGNKVTYRTQIDAGDQKIPLTKIRYLANANNVYEHIAYIEKNKTIHKLMWLEVEGKMNLYLELIPVQERADHGRNMDVSYTTDIIKTYVLRRNDTTFLIGKKNFEEGVKPLVAEFPELIEKLSKKEYNYENIEGLVREYNRLSDLN
jgi:hypothetical protein